MLPLLALSTPRECASSSESSSCGDSDSSSDSESSSEHGAATTLALDASTLDGVDTGRRGGGGGRGRSRGRSRSRSKSAKQRKRAKKRLKKQRKRAEKERRRREKRRKKREEEGREMDDYEGDYSDDGVLCFDEREWERYLKRGVYDLPELRGRGKKECMSREEWMELHDAHTAAAAATPTAAGVQAPTSPFKTTNMR